MATLSQILFVAVTASCDCSLSGEMRCESCIHVLTLTEPDFGILVPPRNFPQRKRGICNKLPKCLRTSMYLAKYQHLPDLAAFPIDVKLLLYFL